MNGKLIVIEGVDGSGKTTQTELLIKHLEENKIPSLLVDFPQYEGFYGKIVSKYLKGEFGSIEQTSPFLIAIIYALDRSTIREKIVSFLKGGGVVVANRYVPSNVAHQAANIKEPEKQEEFINWVQELEYKELKLPKEDLVIYLYLPWEIGMQRSKEKSNDKLDILEKSIEHRRETETLFLKLLSRFKHWHRVDCVDEAGKQLGPTTIHDKIISLCNLTLKQG